MKNFLVIFSSILVLSVIGLTIANNNKALKIDDTTFTLKYSNCDGKKQSCLNEYYKKDEKDKEWTELFTIVYEKTTDNPIDFARALADQVEMADVSINYQDNYALVLFLIPYENDNGESMIEQNMAKVMKYDKGDGIVSQQYAIRVKSGSNKQETADTLENNFKKYLPTIAETPVQKVYLKPLEKW